jgi:hypothetical protein
MGRWAGMAALLLVLVHASCADADQTAADPPAVTAVTDDWVDAEAEWAPLDSAAIAAALAEDAAAEADAARIFRARQASMSTREACMRQIEALPQRQRQVLEDACNRLRSDSTPAR